jgi:hypothetical protein
VTRRKPPRTPTRGPRRTRARVGRSAPGAFSIRADSGSRILGAMASGGRGARLGPGMPGAPGRPPGWAARM